LWNCWDDTTLAQNSDGSGTVGLGDIVGYAEGSRGDGTLNAIQATAANKLMYRAAPTGENGIYCPGSGDYLEATTGNVTQGTNDAVWLGARFTSEASFTAINEAFFAWTNAAYTVYIEAYSGTTQASKWASSAGTLTGPANFATSTTYYILGKWSLANSRFFLDSYLDANGTTGVTNNYTRLTIGNVGNIAGIACINFTLHKVFGTSLDLNPLDLATVQYILANQGNV
jgi:hypothetical protein